MDHDRTAQIPYAAGLKALAPRYQVLLCDIWGVVHNGIVAYEPASEALRRFRKGGGCVILVTNAPRPAASVAVQLDRLGVPRSAYDAIVTSGDITRAAIVERQGQTLHHMGPPRDLPLFEGLSLRFGSVEEADYVVCTGLHNDETETVEDYRERLERMRGRGAWMVCANPDLVVERGHRLIPCAGALALAYEEMGGQVHYAGKPHRPVYEAALALAARISGKAGIDPAGVLAIGDAIRTDIAGAEAFGIHSLLVARGIHGGELKLDALPLDSEHAQDWLSRQVARPTAVTDMLVWSEVDS
jgi:HAD superfamily hydrolase (TIGR01459 family)